MRIPSLAQSLFVFLLALTCIGIWRYHQAPPPRAMDAPPHLFSSLRAFEDVSALCKLPHPAGSAPANAVAGHIENRIRELGLTPEIQEAFIYRPPDTVATVHNVLARIEGTGNGDAAVALMAHYDSVAFGPGAADDGAGVAALLESMRAMLAAPRPVNDLLFLFTDGEEGRRFGGTGLRGAHAFVEQHPWARNVRVVINFDARGVRGPSYIYQTSGLNNWLIQELAHSGCKASATSLMSGIYKSMPVGSDLTAFIDAGIPGYDCAFIHGLEKYHTALDTPGNLSLASLQHHGEYAFTLACHLANQPLEDASRASADLVYFDAPLAGLVHYGRPLASLFTLLAVMLYGALLARNTRRGAITLAGFLKCLLHWLLAVLVGGLLVLALIWGWYQSRGVYVLYNGDALSLGVLFLLGGFMMYLIPRCVRRFGKATTCLAFTFPWVILLLLAACVMPGATYFFTWPLVFSLLPLVYDSLRNSASDSLNSAKACLWAAAAAPVLFFGIGTLLGFYAALTVLFIPLHAVLFLLCLGLLTPQLTLLAQMAPRSVYGLPAVAGLMLAFGILHSGFSPQCPKFNSLTYGYDADSNTAFYMSCDDETDEWTEHFFPESASRSSIADFIPVATRDYLRAPAPLVPLLPPTLEVLSTETSGEYREIHVKIDTARKAEVIEIYLAGTKVLEAKVNGVLMKDQEGGTWRLTHSIYRGGGILLDLKIPAQSPVKLRIADHKYFPEPSLNLPPRPARFIPKPNTVDFNLDPLKSEESVAVKTFTL